jgi:hypothetical protein
LGKKSQMPVAEHTHEHTTSSLPPIPSEEDFSRLDFAAVKLPIESFVQVPLHEIDHMKERVRNMSDAIDNLREENDELYSMLDGLSLRVDPNRSSQQEHISDEQEQKLIKTIIRLRSERNHYRQLWEQMNIKENLSSPTNIPSKGKKINLIKRVKEYIKSNTPINERANMSTLELMNHGWQHPANGLPVAEPQDMFKDLNKEEYNTHLNTRGGAHVVHLPPIEPLDENYDLIANHKSENVPVDHGVLQNGI